MNGSSLMQRLVCLAAAVWIGPFVRGDEPSVSGGARFYPAGTEPPPLKQKHVKPEKLVPSPHVSRVNLFHYAMQLTMDSEMRVDQKTKSGDGTRWRTQSESGDTQYTPRISVCARNSELPQNCLLVIEYFSKPAAGKTEGQRICVEHITLPAIAKGQTLTLDAEGVELYKYEHKSGYGLGHKYEQSGGQELYGVICSLFQKEKLLMQVCTQAPLTQDCSEFIPERQEQIKSGTRFYFM